ncbi:MAG: SDR family oxidoreductase [Bacteroidota bacterium]
MKDKVVIITGGSSGIGRALAYEFGRMGSRVLITGRKQEALEEVCNQLTKEGITIHYKVADAAVEKDNKDTIDEAVKLYGQIDVLICNAGISMRALFEELDLSVFHKVFQSNFYGVVYAVKFALPYIIKSKGSIVGVSSINGRVAGPARTAYSSSKFAMEGFLDTLRMEVMKHGVHVLCVRPGFTSTNIRFTALKADGSPQGDSPRKEEKMMSSEEVAHHMYKAVIKRQRDLTLTLMGKTAVALNRLFPAWMDKIVYRFMASEPDSPLK